MRLSGNDPAVGRGSLVTVACAAALAAAAGTAAASDHPANVNWPEYLPAMEGGAQVQPGRVPFCRKASVRCIDSQMRRMRSLQRRLGCDHRGVFATTYLELTREIRFTRSRRPGFFDDWNYLFREVAAFANVYFNSVRAWDEGRDVPEAWRIAFETARAGDANAAQDMLLGINAHVQNDMPFVLASLGLRKPGGESRKPDHDAANAILGWAYERVVTSVADRYDPVVRTTNARATFADDVLGLEMVKGWREGVWRNAERLLGARDDAERREVAQQIEDHAAAWARSIAAPQMPGYRAQRDAYCAAR